MQKIITYFERYSLSTGLLLVYLWLLVTRISIFPDYLKLYKVDSAGFFGLIIGATTSILGILIAVILLTFEVSKDISFRRKGRNLFNQSNVIYILSIALSIIILALLSYIYIEDFKSNNNKNIGYFIGWLFVVFICTIFPVTKKILETSNQLQSVKKEINSLIFDDFNAVKYIEFDTYILHNYDYKLIHIRDELIQFISNCDYEGYNSLFESLNIKAFELIGDGNNRTLNNTILQGITHLWNAGKIEALRVGNHQYYQNVWHWIENIYHIALISKNHLLNYEEINWFIRDYIRFLVRNNLGDALTTGSKKLSQLFEFFLKENCPPQENISDLYFMFDREKVEHNSDSSIQWDKIIDFIHLVEKIRYSSIANKDKELYQSCSNDLELIVYNVLSPKFENLKELQVGYIIIEIYSKMVYHAGISIDKGLYDNTSESIRMNPRIIAQLIKNDSFYVHKILQFLSDFIIISQRKNMLDGFATLNDWVTICRQISAFYEDNELSIKSFAFILETIFKIKVEIQLNQLQIAAELYLDIKKQLESIKRILINDKGTDLEILRTIDEQLSSFVEIKENKSFRIIKWN